MKHIDIEPDIRHARTPPARLYCDPGIYQTGLEQVLAPSWQLIGDAASIAEAGQISPVRLLPDSLDVPLLLTCDMDGNPHCLSNVCTHRGNLICQAAQQADNLRCPYHSRRFELDGKFRYAPGFENAENFPGDSDHLPSLPLQHWGPLLFTSLQPDTPFADWLGPVCERLAWLPLHEFTLDEQRSQTYDIPANWILYCENYLDYLHIPYIHPELNQTLDFARYRIELFEHGNLQLGLAAEGQAAFDLPESSPDYGKNVAAYYFWLFPNLMLNFYPWGLSVNVVEPVAVDRTRVQFLSYVWQAEKLQSGAGASLDLVEQQDEAVVITSQAGLRSRLYQRGRYAPEHEAGCHQFHRLLTARL